jgi:acetolactate synthase regulatory subunit
MRCDAPARHVDGGKLPLDFRNGGHEDQVAHAARYLVELRLDAVRHDGFGVKIMAHVSDMASDHADFPVTDDGERKHEENYQAKITRLNPAARRWPIFRWANWVMLHVSD